MFECSICFDSFNDDQGVVCNCKAGMCLECFEAYIDSCNGAENQKVLPTCISGNCKIEFTISDAKKVNREKEYAELLFYCTHNEYDQKFLMEKIKIDLIKKTRDEKIKLANQFPQAIKLTIDIVFKDKLNKVNMSNINYLTKEEVIRCPNPFCKAGVLKLKEKSVQCTDCLNEYCKVCDDKIRSNQQHICKQENIDTKIYMKQFTPCPECKTPVQKISGCDAVTCAICKTKFWYTTGKKGEAGNHDNLSITLKKHEQFLDYINLRKYKDSEIKQLQIFSSLEPTKIDIEKEILQHVTDESLASKIKVAYIYEKKKINENKIKLYNHYVEEIIQLDEKNELKLSYLKNLIERYQKQK